MKIPSPIRSFICKCDLFSVNVGFRFNQQRQYSSLTGGILSILMIILVIAIFTQTGLQTWNKQNIISIQDRKIYQDPPYLSLNLKDNFFFATSLMGIDMNSGIRYFDITLTYTYVINKQKTEIKRTLVPCKRQIWAALNNQYILNSYDSIGFDKWLCPPQDDLFQFYGKFSSEYFIYVKLGVQTCNNSTDPTRRCANITQINDYLTKNQEFSFNYYFINTIINPQQKQFIKYYIQDKNYFPFTLTQGMTANLYVSSYTVVTDQSLSPLEQISTKNGGIIKQNAQIFPYYVTGNQYIKFYLRKSNQQLFFYRVFYKIDETLSYFGGLFSFFLTFFLFVKFYNQMCYELEIAKNIYKYDKDNSVDSNGFNFFNYLIYLCYFVLKKFGFSTGWQLMEKYDKSLKEIRKQMDVILIFKKILFAQKLANTLLSPQQLIALHLQDKLTLSQAQEIRQSYFLPKSLMKQFSDKQRNPLSSRLGTQPNQEGQDTSKSLQFRNKQTSLIKSQEKPNFFEQIMDDKIIQDESKIENQKKIKKFKIKTKVSDLSQLENGYSNKAKLFDKLMKTITFLANKEDKDDKNDCINSKIMSGIGSDIKGIIDATKNNQQQKIIQNNSQDNFINQKNPNKLAQKQQKQKQNNQKINSSKLSRRRMKIKDDQFKQINDIVVIEYFQMQNKPQQFAQQ